MFSLIWIVVMIVFRDILGLKSVIICCILGSVSHGKVFVLYIWNCVKPCDDFNSVLKDFLKKKTQFDCCFGMLKLPFCLLLTFFFHGIQSSHCMLQDFLC